jgi:ATP-dependent DNA ligase
VTTLNNVFGVGFIPIIGIMRGTLAPENFDGFYIATEKIDGNRRLIMCKETGVEIYTRSGHRDYGLVEIEAQAKQLPVGWVFDTECIAIGNWSDSIECRQASASILNSGGTKVGVKAFVFDMLMQHEYDIGRSTLSAIARKTYLAATMGDEESIKLMHDWFDHKGLPTLAGAVTYVATKCKSMHPTVNLPNITALPILGIVRNKKEAIELAKPIWETGGEGVMLVDHKSAYEVSPNPRKTLLKIKATQEYVLKCVGVVEGDNKYQGMLGAIEVEYTPAGSPVTYIVKVGSGFTDLYRQVYWTSPKIIVGTMVEIESFGESRNAQGEYSLNCPIFKRIVGSVE